MISLFAGENSFEVGRAINQLVDDFDGDIERIDGSELKLAQLPDLLMGGSLFASSRLIIIKNLSENKPLWNSLVDWLLKVSDDIHLVLVDPKPDKRTATFKSIKSLGEVKEFAAWSDRDTAKAMVWVMNEAQSLGLELDKKCVQFLVQWVGVDQWQLYNALQKLSLVNEVTIDIIRDLVDPNPSENVFNVFEVALKGDLESLNKLLKNLQQSEDIYRLSALLMSQAFQLAVVAAADKTSDISTDFGIHPFVLSKLRPYASRLGKSGVLKIISIFTELDDAMKISKADPWILLERALIKVTNVVS